LTSMVGLRGSLGCKSLHRSFVAEWQNPFRRVSKWRPAVRPEATTKEKRMSRYIDGFVLPVAKKNLVRYRRVARVAGKVWRDHGALEYVECVADQLTSKHEGKTFTSLFPKLARVKPGEVVVFSWIVYKSKADAKRVMKKVMADPRLSRMMDPDNMPFDMSRMAWAGFKPIVEA
jgi:uncharacterized protein YbaA (DUF1428 family)